MPANVVQLSPVDVQGMAPSLSVNVNGEAPIGSVNQLTNDGKEPFPWLMVAGIVVAVLALAWLANRGKTRLTL